MTRVLMALLLAVPTCAPADAASKAARWRTYLNRSYATFDWNCTSTKAVDARLRARLQAAIGGDDHGPATWGDRGVLVSLRRNHPLVLFVPTVCGATGNCEWQLYDSRTRAFLGALGGQFLFVREVGGSWPTLISYTREGGCEGSLSRYQFRGGRYRWINDDLPVSRCNPEIIPLPGKLSRATVLCSQYGN
jgi:hypothetical protein